MKNKRFLLALLLAFLLHTDFHQLNSDSLQEKKDQEALQHEVTVTLKLVKVYVTDKKGNPAMYLTQDDFILYDNGKVQTITEFERHILSPTEKEAEKGPVKTKQTLGLKTPQRNRRKFFLLIDLFRNDIYGFALSKKAAVHFIETQLSPEDEVTVMTYSFLRGLIFHEYLSTDNEKAKETIQRLKEIPGPTANDGFSFEFNVKMTWSFIGDIRNFARSLKLIPGHKNLLFFSAGISQSLLYSRNYPEIRSRYEEMCRELSAADASVFTVNTEGIRGYAKWGLRPGDHALKILSDATGGKYYHDIDHYRYIAEDIQYFVGNYYILGFYINEKWDGKYHKIKVELKRKDKKELSLADIYSFSPQRFALIIDGLEYGVQKIAAVIKCNILDIDNPEIKISIYLFNHSSKERVALPFTFQVLENNKDSKTLLLDIDLPDMEPGEYSLEFTAEETTAKLRSQMNRALIVRKNTCTITE